MTLLLFTYSWGMFVFDFLFTIIPILLIVFFIRRSWLKFIRTEEQAERNEHLWERYMELGKASVQADVNILAVYRGEPMQVNGFTLEEFLIMEILDCPTGQTDELSDVVFTCKPRSEDIKFDISIKDLEPLEN